MAYTRIECISRLIFHLIFLLPSSVSPRTVILFESANFPLPPATTHAHRTIRKIAKINMQTLAPSAWDTTQRWTATAAVCINCVSNMFTHSICLLRRAQQIEHNQMKQWNERQKKKKKQCMCVCNMWQLKSCNQRANSLWYVRYNSTPMTHTVTEPLLIISNTKISVQHIIYSENVHVNDPVLYA